MSAVCAYVLLLWRLVAAGPIGCDQKRLRAKSRGWAVIDGRRSGMIA